MIKPIRAFDMNQDELFNHIISTRGDCMCLQHHPVHADDCQWVLAVKQLAQGDADA